MVYLWLNLTWKKVFVLIWLESLPVQILTLKSLICLHLCILCDWQIFSLKFACTAWFSSSFSPTIWSSLLLIQKPKVVLIWLLWRLLLLLWVEQSSSFFRNITAKVTVPHCFIFSLILWFFLLLFLFLLGFLTVLHQYIVRGCNVLSVYEYSRF
jgi:hypothetical protein